jgi:hypothetical protein
MRYYDLKANWRKVKRHIPAAEGVLVRDFNKYTFGRYGKEFTAGRFPAEFDLCDWQPGGYWPAFWRYVCHGACHWLANFNLHLAMCVEPREPWRILTSQKHSTVWNGGDMLFEFNFQAFGGV